MFEFKTNTAANDIIYKCTERSHYSDKFLMPYFLLLDRLCLYLILHIVRYCIKNRFFCRIYLRSAKQFVYIFPFNGKHGHGEWDQNSERGYLCPQYSRVGGGLTLNNPAPYIQQWRSLEFKGIPLGHYFFTLRSRWF